MAEKNIIQKMNVAKPVSITGSKEKFINTIRNLIGENYMTSQLKSQRWYSVEDDLAQQLNNSQPVHINSQGELVLVEETIERIDGQTVDSKTGQPTTQLKPQRWYSWHQSNPARFLQEQQAMSMRFSNFKLHNLTNGLTWNGRVKPKGGGRSYQIAITYPSDFPYSSPKVYVIDPKIKSPKHQYLDGSLCLMYPGDGTWKPNTTAVQIVTMAAAWLFCFEYHQKNCPTNCSDIPCNYWPGKEAQH